MLRQLAMTVRFNTAAVLMAAQRPDDARESLVEVARLLSSAEPLRPPGNSAPAPSSGQAIGPDGAWSQSYEQARRNLEDRLNALRTLGRAAGTDLGRLDANTLVSEAYRSPIEVRMLARSLIAAQFSAVPNVMLELVDQFFDAGG